MSYSGILSGIYPALFTVKPDEEGFLGKTAYSYSDVLCGNVKISSFLASCSKILILPIVLILGISFMYVITICLIMCTANINNEIITEKILIELGGNT